MASKMKVGDRVSVEGYDVKGTIKFYGKAVHEGDAQGKIRVGIVLDQAVGKNKGTVGGHEYFKCKPKCGIFIMKKKVTVIEEELVKPETKENPLYDDSVEVGDRVTVVGYTSEGTIRFIGDIADKAKVGVELDEPEGKNNGSVAGVQYFTCKDKHGVITLPKKVKPVEGAANTTTAVESNTAVVKKKKKKKSVKTEGATETTKEKGDEDQSPKPKKKVSKKKTPTSSPTKTEDSDETDTTMKPKKKASKKKTSASSPTKTEEGDETDATTKPKKKTSKKKKTPKSSPEPAETENETEKVSEDDVVAKPTTTNDDDTLVDSKKEDDDDDDNHVPGTAGDALFTLEEEKEPTPSPTKEPEKERSPSPSPSPQPAKEEEEEKEMEIEGEEVEEEDKEKEIEKEEPPKEEESAPITKGDRFKKKSFKKAPTQNDDATAFEFGGFTTDNNNNNGDDGGDDNKDNDEEVDVAPTPSVVEPKPVKSNVNFTVKATKDDWVPPTQKTTRADRGPAPDLYSLMFSRKQDVLNAETKKDDNVEQDEEFDGFDEPGEKPALLAHLSATPARRRTLVEPEEKESPSMVALWKQNLEKPDTVSKRKKPPPQQQFKQPVPVEDVEMKKQEEEAAAAAKALRYLTRITK